MARIIEINGRKYIEELHSIDALEARLSRAVEGYGWKISRISPGLAGIYTERFHSIMALYFDVGMIDYEGFLGINIDECFRGD